MPNSIGTGYIQPGKIHQEWHTDISYLNLGGSFYFLISVLDGFSRYLVHWEIRESMTEQDVELVLARAMEKHPGVTPRIISDNGPQFIAKDFKEFIRTYNLTHVRTSPYYPQSNGKLERWHGSIKQECIRKTCPATKEEAQKRVTSYVQHYNHVRLHSAIGYITPADCLAGLRQVIGEERDRKLEEARARRQAKRSREKQVASSSISGYNQRTCTEDRATLRSDPSAAASVEVRSGWLATDTPSLLTLTAMR